MLRLLAPLVLLGLLAGCTTRFRKANELAEQGRFEEAAALFERLHAESPDDREIAQLLERARYRAVEQALGQSRRARLEGKDDEAHRTYGRGLDLRERWNLKLDGALESTIEEARESLVQVLRRRAHPLLQASEGLALESLERRHDFVLRHPEQRAIRDELVTQTREAGSKKCRALRGSALAETPHWATLVARYCAHFQNDGPREWPLVELASSASPSVVVDGLPAGLSGQLEAGLLVAFTRSPWFSERGTLAASVLGQGRVAASRTERPVQLSAEWTERVPYTVNVVKTVEEQVPVTECETYETKNATGQPLTQMREVTKTKTKTKEVVVAETRYRDVPRAFEYAALRVERQAAFTVRAGASAGGVVLGTWGADEHDDQAGYLHDVTFEPAGVRPQRPGFGAPEAFWAANTSTLVGNFGPALAAGYRARFCALGAYTLEEAARCARAVEQVPAPAIQTLREVLGNDAPLAPALLGAPRAR